MWLRSWCPNITLQRRRRWKAPIVHPARAVRSVRPHAAHHRITGGGVTAGIDFALVVAGELFGDSVAQAIQLAIEYDPAPPYRSGAPKNAPTEVVQEVTLASADSLARRRTIVERISG